MGNGKNGIEEELSESDSGEWKEWDRRGMAGKESGEWKEKRGQGYIFNRMTGCRKTRSR